MAISIPGDKLVVNHICSSMSISVFTAQSASKFPLPQSSDVTDPSGVLTIYSCHLPEKSHPLQRPKSQNSEICYVIPPHIPFPWRKRDFKSIRNRTKCKLKYSGAFPCATCKGLVKMPCQCNHEWRILVVFTWINVISWEFRSHSTLKPSGHWSHQVHCTYKHRPGLKAASKTVWQ